MQIGEERESDSEWQFSLAPPFFLQSRLWMLHLHFSQRFSRTYSLYLYILVSTLPSLSHSHTPKPILTPKPKHARTHPHSQPDLLDEAKERCRAELVERKSDLTPEELDATAEALGYGAVKYFDLSKNRITNYQFAYDAMCDLKGNTGMRGRRV